MSAPKPHRPLGLRMMNAMGRALDRLGWTVPSLNEEKLLDAARRMTSLTDFGGEHFRRGLTELIRALEQEAQLNTLGRLMARTTIQGYLRDRLEIQEYRKRNPELAHGEIRRPLIIVGLPRTGTTILFNLLAQDPNNRAPLAWETESPHPPPETASYTSDPRIAECQKRFDSLYKMAPALPAIHEMAAEMPQECVAIMAHEFMSVQFFIMYAVPSYQAWLDEQSYIPALEFHRRFLQHLQFHHRGERWVLKTPGHLAILDELLQIYPDACIVHTHRDPQRVMPSLASLSYTLRGIGSDAVNAHTVGRQQLELWSRHLERMLRTRDRLQEKRHQFFDVQFEDVVNDPIGLIERIYRHFELPLCETAHKRMRALLAASPREKHGRHRYSPGDFGLTARDGERFAGYRDRFGISREAAA